MNNLNTRYDDIQEQKAIEVIRYLKSSGTSIELIMGATGLTKEEIEKLSNTLFYIIQFRRNIHFV